VNFGTDTKGTLGKHGSEIQGTLSYQDLAILSNKNGDFDVNQPQNNGFNGKKG
jgi:hypothetical protein